MQRGFKSRCEQISKRYRKQLGLTLEDPLPYERLAEVLDVRLWTPEDVPGLDPVSLKQLTVTDAWGWSAVTISVGTKRVIVMNSSHSERRSPNNVVHELAHIILDHRAARVDVSDDGHLLFDTYGKEQEEEADWLSGTLLLPRDGLLAVYRRLRHNQESVADHFGVSHQLVVWRLRLTGIQRQVHGHRNR